MHFTKMQHSYKGIHYRPAKNARHVNPFAIQKVEKEEKKKIDQQIAVMLLLWMMVMVMVIKVGHETDDLSPPYEDPRWGKQGTFLSHIVHAHGFINVYQVHVPSCQAHVKHDHLSEHAEKIG